MKGTRNMEWRNISDAPKDGSIIWAYEDEPEGYPSRPSFVRMRWQPAEPNMLAGWYYVDERGPGFPKWWIDADPDPPEAA